MDTTLNPGTLETLRALKGMGIRVGDTVRLKDGQRGQLREVLPGAKIRLEASAHGKRHILTVGLDHIQR